MVLYLKGEEDGSEVRDGVKTIENNDENWPYCKGDFPEVEGDKIVIIS